MAASSQFPEIFDDATRVQYKQSVFKSLISSKGHRRNHSADDAMTSKNFSKTKYTPPAPFFAVDEARPVPNQLPLGERAPNRDSPDGPQQTQKTTAKQEKNGLHKKKKSAVSLKSLRSYMDRRDHKPYDTQEDDSEWKPKKAKSSNSLSAILKRSQRTRKGDASKDVRDKENRSPVDMCDSTPSSPVWTPSVPPPLRAQPGRTHVQEKRRTLEEEMSIYTPKAYTPTQQRNFFDYQQPSLTRRTEAKPRPKSDCLSGNRKVKEFIESRSPSGKSCPAEPLASASSRGLEKPQKMPASAPRSENEKHQDANPKRQSRVQAAISAFNAREQEAEMQKRLNSKDIESEFEKLLDARNIPHNMRDKMRSLDTNIKADFIQKDRIENTTPHSSSPTVSTNGSTGRRGRKKDQKDERQPQDGKGSRSRSRSRGFSFSKSSTSPKKRSEGGSSHRRPKSADLSQPVGLYKTSTPSTSMTSLSAAACVDTAADPSDFVHYLREIQKPEMIEVGKLHKLRLLLRNETVSWVHTFIADGGMDEIVQLLYRIMKVEWREEHEDNLLHETLLCLKALCTTSIALKHLAEVESELFPALLKMLFDEEKKGPSEFTTRGIIINLLFTQLSTAPSEKVAAARAGQILSYLRDPTPPEENQPLSFIANIYQSRPYRVWCKEVTNVTKEVFWIFLHHLNVIPVIKSSEGSQTSFHQRHFPPPRPPVPAAPYVGGVEWDATNYLAAHLDLMNGLIACLPTMDERNQLRTELRASGFEKVMGGSLRTCKEKFYFAVHDCLRTWVAAAVEDGWPYTHIREGPPRAEPASPTKSAMKVAGGSPKKGAGVISDKPPKLELAIDVSPSPSTPKEDNFGNWL